MTAAPAVSVRRTAPSASEQLLAARQPAQQRRTGPSTSGSSGGNATKARSPRASWRWGHPAAAKRQRDGALRLPPACSSSDAAATSCTLLEGCNGSSGSGATNAAAPRAAPAAALPTAVRSASGGSATDAFRGCASAVPQDERCQQCAGQRSPEERALPRVLTVGPAAASLAVAATGGQQSGPDPKPIVTVRSHQPRVCTIDRCSTVQLSNGHTSTNMVLLLVEN